jgi:hypothetical protein
LEGLAQIALNHIRKGKKDAADKAIQVARDKALDEGNLTAVANLDKALEALDGGETTTARKYVELVATGIWIE